MPGPLIVPIAAAGVVAAATAIKSWFDDDDDDTPPPTTGGGRTKAPPPQSQYGSSESNGLKRFAHESYETTLQPMRQYVDPSTGKTSAKPGGQMYLESNAAIREWQRLQHDPLALSKAKEMLWLAGYYGTKKPYGGGDMLSQEDIDAMFAALNDANINGKTWQAAIQPKIGVGLQEQFLQDEMNRLEQAEAKHRQTLQERAELDDLAQFQTEVREFAQNNGIRMNDKQLAAALDRYQSGETSLEALKTEWRDRYLVSAFPAWADDIKAGRDLIDIASPYIEATARTLERNPADIDLFDDRIRGALQSVGPDGKHTQVPLWAFERELRKDPAWRKTENANNLMGEWAARLRADFSL